MKKKYGLFKVLTVLLLLVVVLTYFIKGRDGNIAYVGIADLFFNYVESFYYFFDTALFVLFIGGFYGFINRIPAYKDLVNKIASRFENNKKNFIIIITCVFALVSSLTGLNTMLLLFVPFVISIILLIGYDKLVAISSTIGAIIVGYIGGIFITIKGNSGYQSFDKIVGLDGNWDNILSRILLLVVLLALLIFYVISHTKKVESGDAKYKLTQSDNLFYELKEKTTKKKEKVKKIGYGPLVLVIFLLFVISILGFMPWNDLFGITCFNDFHTWLTEIKIGNYSIFSNLISSSIGAFGTWGNIGNYMMLLFVIVLTIAILALVYRIKFEEVMDSFLYGVKKMIPAAMIVILAYTVLVTSYNNGFVETVIKDVTSSMGNNQIFTLVHGLLAMGGSILNVDIFYINSGIFANIIAELSDVADGANLNVYSVMFQSFYGLVQFFGPTSLMLIVGLSYLEVSYKEWIKYIWRFILYVLIAIIVVLMIVSLL